MQRSNYSTQSNTQKRSGYNSDDRPIASSGKYNLNFIDWNNEFEAILDSGNFQVYDNDNENQPEECPIYGMDISTYYQLIRQEAQEIEQQQDEENKLPDQYRKMLKKMKMGKSSKECAICCNTFDKGQIVYNLPCKHMFHAQCLDPWLNKKDSCPNCRVNLVKMLKANQ